MIAASSLAGQTPSSSMFKANSDKNLIVMNNLPILIDTGTFLSTTPLKGKFVVLLCTLYDLLVGGFSGKVFIREKELERLNDMS